MTARSRFTKGIILARSAGTGLFPTTSAVGKSLLPIYDKPMIYYPLSVLILAGIGDVLIIASLEEIRGLERLLSDGSQLGLRIQYAVESPAQGSAQAFHVGRSFVNGENVALILADQLFSGVRFEWAVMQAVLSAAGATVFTKSMVDPRCHDVVEIDSANRPVAIAEKPYLTTSRLAVTGFYLYDQRVVDITANLRSSRGADVCLADVTRDYLERGQLSVVQLDAETAWFDLRTHAINLTASVFVEMVQSEQGKKIGCIEEAAFLRGFITAHRLLELSSQSASSYCKYLQRLAVRAIARSVD